MPTLDTNQALTNPAQPKLKQTLGLFDATCIALGSMIGSGIFVSTNEAFRLCNNSPSLTLLAWVVGALVSFLGALCFAELSASLPKSGGEYEYLKKAFGRPVAFLFVWTQLIAYASGSIAIMAFTSGSYLAELWSPFPQLAKADWSIILSAFLVLLLSGLNCLGLDKAAALQNWITSTKFLGILLFLGLGIAALSSMGQTGAPSLSWLNLSNSGGSIWGFGGAVIATLWAYDGWNNLTRISEEAKDPSITLPRALIISLVICACIYIAINVLYFGLLTPSRIIESQAIAIDSAWVMSMHLPLLSSLPLATILGAFICFSAFGAFNGSIAANARIYFAAARDGLFFPIFKELNPSSGAPVAAIIFQAILAIALIFFGRTFSNLLSYFSFSAWLFYGASAVALIVLRNKGSQPIDTFRVKPYPLIPWLFAGVSFLLVLSQILNAPLQSLLCFGAILAGLLFLPLFTNKSR